MSSSNDGRLPGEWSETDAAVPGSAARTVSDRAVEKESALAKFMDDGKSSVVVGERMTSIRRRSAAVAVSEGVERGELDPAVARHLYKVLDTVAGDQDQRMIVNEQQRQRMEDMDHRMDKFHEELRQSNQELRGELRQSTQELRGETQELREEMRGEMRSMRDALDAVLLAVQARNSRPVSPIQPVARQERNSDSPAMHAISSTPENLSGVTDVRSRSAGYEEFRTPAQAGRTTGPVTGYRGTALSDGDFSHGPFRATPARGAAAMPYPDGVEDDELVSRDSRTAFRTPRANFSVRGHGEVGVTPASAGRSGHHVDVQSPREDAPARQVHSQTTDARSERTPAGPVPTDDGYDRQNGESATAGLYPTSVIDNGEDTVLNVAGEIFTSQHGDLVEGHFSMFHTDWTRHMEMERHADWLRKKKLDALSKEHRKGIPQNLLPELTARPSDGGSGATPTTITGRPLSKPTATFGMGKDTDVADSVTYAQAIESYMGTNRLDYDRYGVALLAGNTTTLYSNAYFNFTRPFGEKITWRKAVFYFLKATPASLTTDEAQWMMSRIVLTAEQPLPEFVNNFLLLRFRAGNHMRLSKVMDYLFRAVGVPMEMMLRTHTRHDPDHHLELYNLLEVLAGAEQERNRYRAAATSERVTQERIDKYAAATGMHLRGSGSIPLGARAPGPNGTPVLRGHSAAEPPTKLATAEPQLHPQQRFDDRRDGQQRNQGWRPNPSRVQQPRGNFAPRSHQTQPDSGDAAEIDDADEKYVSGDVGTADTVTNHQTDIPDVQYDDSEAWMEFDADAITFEHEDDYMGHWPAPSSHHVQIGDHVEETVSGEWLRTSDFDWGTEPLEPRLACFMGVTDCHSLELSGPMTDQGTSSKDKGVIALAGCTDPVVHDERVAHVVAPGSMRRGEDTLEPPNFSVHIVAMDGFEASEHGHNGCSQMDCAIGDAANAELAMIVHRDGDSPLLLDGGPIGPAADFAASRAVLENWPPYTAMTHSLLVYCTGELAVFSHTCEMCAFSILGSSGDLAHAVLKKGDLRLPPVQIASILHTSQSHFLPLALTAMRHGQMHGCMLIETDAGSVTLHISHTIWKPRIEMGIFCEVTLGYKFRQVKAFLKDFWRNYTKFTGFQRAFWFSLRGRFFMQQRLVLGVFADSQVAP
ncbi:hypothetical protein H4R20_000953 [Coemansia guatemalensis]|uniref:Uncharacterized protein n=1 Tax=Coemansia guatemalensis TaxID=2761395 RepID=A0A9W8I0H1_9FUNG|nr:hypothetical protein H4R20_000953 [Coemansia guatemalensis]